MVELCGPWFNQYTVWSILCVLTMPIFVLHSSRRLLNLELILHEITKQVTFLSCPKLRGIISESSKVIFRMCQWSDWDHRVTPALGPCASGSQMRVGHLPKAVWVVSRKAPSPACFCLLGLSLQFFIILDYQGKFFFLPIGESPWKYSCNFI